MAVTLPAQKLSGEIVSAGDVDHMDEIFMAFSPAKDSSKKYSQIFDEGLVELRKSGKLQEILDRYGVKDWK